MSRTQRRRFAPALVALAAFAGIAAGTSAGTFTVAAGDQEQPRWPRRAALTIDPPLSRASAAAEEARAQQLMNTVVFEHAVFERAVAEKAKTGVDLGRHRGVRDARQLVDAGIVVLGWCRLREHSVVLLRRARVRPQRRAGNARAADHRGRAHPGPRRDGRVGMRQAARAHVALAAGRCSNRRSRRRLSFGLNSNASRARRQASMASMHDRGVSSSTGWSVLRRGASGPASTSR